MGIEFFELKENMNILVPHENAYQRKISAEKQHSTQMDKVTLSSDDASLFFSRPPLPLPSGATIKAAVLIRYAWTPPHGLPLTQPVWLQPVLRAYLANSRNQH